MLSKASKDPHVEPPCLTFPDRNRLYSGRHMALASSILIYGHDPVLLDTRRWVLEKARFRIATAAALPAVLAAMTQEAPDLLVLCHTLAPDERTSARTAAASLRPPVKTLSFCAMHPVASEEGISDATVDSLAGAEGLIAAARRLLD
jgi:hypothetical protein